MRSSAPTTAGSTLAELATATGAVVQGDAATRVTHVGTLESATAGAITFLANPRYRSLLSTTSATAVIVAPAEAAATALPRLIHRNPYAVYAQVATILHPPATVAAGVAPSAVVDPAARIDPTATIGPCAVIGAGAIIGARAQIGAHCSVGADVQIGDAVILAPRVTIYAGCLIGARSIVHSGAVIGADGFGMAEEGGRWLKIPQIGRVRIGEDCEIGANTTIDRGAIDDTVIENDVKLDNLIQIGHNCHIGAHTAIAGCVGVAGSTRIGRNCKVGGAAMINGHLVIADNTIISAATGIFDSIPVAGIYTGTFPALPHREWQHVASEQRRLRTLSARVRSLEQALQATAAPSHEPDTAA